MGEDARDLGEFGLIERLVARLGVPGEGVLIGPGDDAAAVRSTATTLATADLLLEGVHFDLAFSSPADVGWKAMAANVSDIAAMGGVPRYALVSLGAPASTPAATLESLYEGLGECARAFGVSVVGGDTVGADVLIVSVALLGDAGPAGNVQRSGGRPGDVVCVTGTVGGAAAGLQLLRAANVDPEAVSLLARHPELASAHRRPMPRTREGQAAAAVGATAMIDVSDGLAPDLGHICDASNLGVELRASSVPVAEGVDDVARWAGLDAVDLALGGGDDYELVIALPAAQLSALSAALAPTRVTPIGELGGSERVVLGADGDRRPLAAAGWEHFS
ncbi:MAG TPA: thiamine-phosphate kinase [Actinomycetota bacterium]|nr:thiamine-phosphate kinase [Actinomycetota bacterium]